jgi:hypothetical protein
MIEVNQEYLPKSQSNIVSRKSKTFRLQMYIPKITLEHLRDIIKICDKHGHSYYFENIVDTKTEEQYTRREIFQLDRPDIYYSIAELKGNHNKRVDAITIVAHSKANRSNYVKVHFDPWFLSITRAGEDVEAIFNEMYLYLKKSRSVIRTYIKYRLLKRVVGFALLFAFTVWVFGVWGETVYYIYNLFPVTSEDFGATGNRNIVESIFVALFSSMLIATYEAYRGKGRVSLYEKREMTFIIKYKAYFAPVITGLVVGAFTFLLNYYMKS